MSNVRFQNLPDDFSNGMSYNEIQHSRKRRGVCTSHFESVVENIKKMYADSSAPAQKKARVEFWCGAFILVHAGVKRISRIPFQCFLIIILCSFFNLPSEGIASLFLVCCF